MAARRIVLAVDDPTRLAAWEARLFVSADPSQNNSHGVYGWGLALMEITRLDMESYEERLVRAVGGEAPKGV